MNLQEIIEKAIIYYPEFFWSGRNEFDALIDVESALVKLKQANDHTKFELTKLELLPFLQKLWE